MDLTLTKIQFRKFAKNVQQRTKQRASQRGVKATGAMNDNMSFDVKVSKNSIQLIYKRPKYADFQDQGVSGVEKKYSTPYKYTTKKPPAKVFEAWAKAKGITPRNKKGQFMSFKSFGFAVSNNIFKFGIKPKKFFTDTFVAEFKNLAEPLKRSYAKDAIELLKTALK